MSDETRARATAERAGAADMPIVRGLPSFDAFYQAEFGAVAGLAYALSGSRLASEDLAQDAFLAAHRRWDEIGKYDNPGAWVRRVVANRAVSLFRRRLAEAKAVTRLSASVDPLPELSAESTDVWRAVRRLPRRQAQVVALFYLEDLPLDDIAAILDQSVNTGAYPSSTSPQDAGSQSRHHGGSTMSLDQRLRRASDEIHSAVAGRIGAPVGEVDRRGRTMRLVAVGVGAVFVGITVGIATLVLGGPDPATAGPVGAQTTIGTSAPDAAFLGWSMENGLLGREGFVEVRLDADEDRPELVDVRLLVYPTLLSDGAYAFQVRIEGTGDICGFLEGTFVIDGTTGQFLNDIFPDPDEMNVGASRPHFPYICEPVPRPGTIDAVLVTAFDLALEPGALTLSNSGGTVRFVVSDD